jgi:hypothetical protein
LSKKELSNVTPASEITAVTLPVKLFSTKPYLIVDVQACIAWGQIRGREDYMDNTLLRIETKSRDTVKLIGLLRANGVDVAQVEEAIKQVRSASHLLDLKSLRDLCVSLQNLTCNLKNNF